VAGALLTQGKWVVPSFICAAIPNVSNAFFKWAEGKLVLCNGDDPKCSLPSEWIVPAEVELSVSLLGRICGRKKSYIFQ